MWLDEDQQWDAWMDLPIVLIVADTVLSISWTQFNSLAIESCRTLPFSLDTSTVRWVSEEVPALDSSVGKVITSVSIERVEMSLEGNDIEIWTRLLIHLENDEILKIYNALDENGIEFHGKPIIGETNNIFN